MSDVLINQGTMEDIGDAIREKLGISDTYLPASMPAAIRSISGGGGGGSAKYSETILWSGTQSSSGSITLNESIESYQMIIFIYTAQSGDAMEGSSVRLVSDVVYGRSYHFTFSEYVVSDLNYYFSGHFDDAITFTIDERGNTGRAAVTLRKIIGIKWETMQTALIYSEEEREVGVWTDGKPLYQKTLHFGALSPSVNRIPHGVSNIEHVTYFEGTIKNPTTGVTIDIPYTNPKMNPYEDGTNIVIWLESAISGYSDGSITFRYTKTTDTPGSGIWTTTCEYAHHYSTDEKVVGTWIDGSTIYEKTFELSSVVGISNSSWTSVSGVTVSNLSKFIGATCMSDMGTHYYLNAFNDNGTLKFLACRDNNGASAKYLTIQYTKTT